MPVKVMLMSIDAEIDVEDTKEGKDLEKALEELEGKEVEIGFIAGQDSEEDGTDVAEVAGINEFGTSTIPSRPFLRNSFDNHQDEINSFCDNLSGKMLSGQIEISQGLKLLGEEQRNHVIDEIRTGDFVENAPATIAKKKSSHPLIDTGQMMQSVHRLVDGQLID